MSSLQPDKLIAYLTLVRGNGMDARIVDAFATNTPTVNIDGEDILAGQIGSYVLIQQAAINVLALVFKIWEEGSFDNTDQRAKSRFISLIPVGEIDSEMFCPWCAPLSDTRRKSLCRRH